MADGDVIFRPIIDGTYGRPALKKMMLRKQMVDHGSYVEWIDGKLRWRWRLPDQVDSGAAYPVMTTVRIASLANAAVPGGIGSYLICFTDPTGLVIGRLSGFRMIAVEYSIVDATLPEEAWAPLVARGVRISRQHSHSVQEFHRAHPDPGRKMGPFGYMVAVRGTALLEAAQRTGLVLPDKMAR